MERNDGVWNDEKFVFYYGYEIFIIPEYMREGLIKYIEDGVEPGSFLLAVLENDLSNAVGRADHNNMKNIPAYAYFLYNFAPHICWGSKEKVRKWLEGGN